jgi:hypothetical protein
MARVDEFLNDGRPDKSGCTGYENSHILFLLGPARSTSTGAHEFLIKWR